MLWHPGSSASCGDIGDARGGVTPLLPLPGPRVGRDEVAERSRAGGCGERDRGMYATWLALVTSSVPSWAAAAPGLSGSSSRSGNHEHTAMAEAVSLHPGASPPCPLPGSPLQGLCLLSAVGLGASSRRDQTLLPNKHPMAWEPRGAKGLGRRPPSGVAPWCPQAHPLWLFLPRRTGSFLPRNSLQVSPSAASCATHPAQSQPLIPGRPSSSSTGQGLNPTCSGRKVRSIWSHRRDWGQWDSP